MSIEDHIVRLVGLGSLVPVIPPYASLPTRRRMFLAKELHDTLAQPPIDLEARFDDLRGDLVSFVIQRAVLIDGFLKLLSPHTLGVWEIRSHMIEPQIRVFGHFAMKDVFVALSYRLRDELGSKSDPFWNHEITCVRSKWGILFPSHKPKTTNDPHKLMTGATYDQYG